MEVEMTSWKEVQAMSPRNRAVAYNQATEAQRSIWREEAARDNLPHGGLKIGDLVRWGGDDPHRVTGLYGGCDELVIEPVNDEGGHFDALWWSVERLSDDLRLPTAEEIARALAKSYGVDPDDHAPLAVICDAENGPLAWWLAYEEQADAVLTLLSAKGFR